jgi:hypothetical protein
MLIRFAGFVYLKRFKNFPKAEHTPTCYAANNVYTPCKMKKVFPIGQRIDHILYKHTSRVKVNTLKWLTCLSRVPGNTDINYSDHEGVCAEFSLFLANGID